ncbi:MAG: hypothetical protein P1U80_13370 [Pseudomonadales bacterium]|nr:hypothetical protein [Pseudomonadales bacterium]
MQIQNQTKDFSMITSRIMKFFLFFCVLITTSSCSLFNKYRNIDQEDLTDEIAAKYAIFAMMSSNSYHNNSRVNFPLEELGWDLITINGEATTAPSVEHSATGLAYDLFRNKQSGSVVIAYRGSDSKGDYVKSNFAIPLSPAYKQSDSEFQELKEKFNITHVTGHSLGGGLALGISVRHGVDAVVFDPTSRVFDGLGDKHKPSDRVLIYQEGEILEKLRSIWSKIGEVMENGKIYKASCDFEGENNHRGDLLAACLLNNGKSVNDDLARVASEL